MSLSLEQLQPIARELGLDGALLRLAGSGGPPAPRVLLLDSSEAPLPDLAALRSELGDDDVLLLWLPDHEHPAPRRLAALRDRLWPRLHVFGLFDAPRGTLLAARAREQVLSPRTTVEKFDTNAAGWNGRAGTPGYAHHRWMRRFVARFADSRGVRRILDFGCGAGWVGIEAARLAPDATLHAFDPSPEMVRLAEANARDSGLERFEGRVGFGESPPFPAQGEAPYDLVYSSGVVSFAPDREAWLDGLARTVAEGGTLVLGDLNATSIGTRRRRGRKPLLPVRELNAFERSAILERMQARGFRCEAWAGYQLSWPVPELMHLSSTRLRGALDGPLLLLNRLASGCDRLLGSPIPAVFDSWVLRLRRA